MMYYFGCSREPGHFLWEDDAGFMHSKLRYDKLPWGYKIDSSLCTGHSGSEEGRASLHHKDGWTAVAFWDRSVDSRPGSNSAFICDEEIDYDEMIRRSKETFPKIWERFNFEVVPV